MTFRSFCFLGLFLTAACQPTPPPAAIPSTPIEALPVRLGERGQPDTIPTPLPDDVIAEADADYLLLSSLYERTIPSVVNIEAEIGQLKTTDTSRGSGFIYDDKGH